MVSLSFAESELYAAVKTAAEVLWIQSVAKDLRISCGLNLHLDASATMFLVNRRGLGKPNHVDMQNLWIQEASAAHEPHGLRVHENLGGRVEVSVGENMTAFQISVLAVGYVRWTGGNSVPATISMKSKFL